MKEKNKQRVFDKPTFPNIIVGEGNILNNQRAYLKPAPRVMPFYGTNADYNTNVSTYYDYLAKFNELLGIMIDQINQNTADIENIYNIINEIINEINRIWGEIKIIFDRLDDIDDEIKNIYDLIADLQLQINNIIENTFTKNDVSKLFVKSIHINEVLPKGFIEATYLNKEFAQILYDLTNKYILQYYKDLNVSTDHISLYITWDKHKIISSKIMELLQQYYGQEAGEINPNYVVELFLHESNYKMPASMYIRPNGSSDVFFFTCDNYLPFTPPNITNEQMFKGSKIWTTGLFIDGKKYIPERDRSFIGYDGDGELLLRDTTFTIANHGYSTGNIERLRFRFTRYDDATGTIDYSRFTCYDVSNGTNAFGWRNDGFYDTQELVYRNKVTKEFDTKEWVFNYGTHEIAGFSNESGNYCLSSIEVTIFSDDWREGDKPGKIKAMEKMAKYNKVDVSNKVPIKYLVIDDATKMYDTQNMTQEQLNEFKRDFEENRYYNSTI